MPAGVCRLAQQERVQAQTENAMRVLRQTIQGVQQPTVRTVGLNNKTVIVHGRSHSARGSVGTPQEQLDPVTGGAPFC